MTDWIHCNTCGVQPTAGPKFHVTSCGHIFCQNCIQKGCVQPKCVICELPHPSVLEINRNLAPDLQTYFLPQEEIAKRQQKQLQQVLQFQNSQRKRIAKTKIDQMKQAGKAIQQMQQKLKQNSDFSKQNKALREQCRQMELESRNLDTQIRQLEKSTAGRSPVNSRSPFLQQHRSPFTQQQFGRKSPSNMMMGFGNGSPSSNGTQMPFGNMRSPIITNQRSSPMVIDSINMVRGVASATNPSPSAISEITTPRMLGFKNTRNTPPTSMWQHRSPKNNPTNVAPSATTANGFVTSQNGPGTESNGGPTTSTPIFNRLPRSSGQ